MATTTKARRLPDDYFELVDQFPLIRIDTPKKLADAIRVIDRLLARQKLGKGEHVYLDALTDLVENYENEHERIPDVSDVETLRFLMESNGFSQPKLALESGVSQSTISAILSQKRQMTKQHTIQFARIFHVSPMVFFPAT